MLLSYNQCTEKYKTKYYLKKAVDLGELYYIEKGVYSDVRFVSELQVISFKYPNAIFTMDSAFYAKHHASCVQAYLLLESSLSWDES